MLRCKSWRSPGQDELGDGHQEVHILREAAAANDTHSPCRR
jgi:hypothetical protein